MHTSGERHTVKTSFIRNIINKQYSHGTPVVGSGDGPEPFLACSIPDLKLYTLAIKFYGADLEVDADGCDE